MAVSRVVIDLVDAVNSKKREVFILWFTRPMFFVNY